MDNSYSKEKIVDDNGIISIMYHRFEENKYPSTNIRVDDFMSHIEIIKDSGFQFISSEEFKNHINLKNKKKMILLTIDDGFLSFYKNAWPILKREKIPFIIFVNTESIGSSGYMSWDQIKEISKFDFVHIGNHSHSHGYLVDKSDKEIEKDIRISIKLFEDRLNHKTKFFAYPFGEYKFELPTFPINEKYGEIKRFKRLLKTIPFPFKKIYPDEKYLNKKNNPPDVKIIFYEDGPDLKNISCYSNEQDRWRKSKIELPSKNELKIILDGKFTTERGRINCSLRENNGNWRWLGIQFVISDL